MISFTATFGVGLAVLGERATRYYTSLKHNDAREQYRQRFNSLITMPAAFTSEIRELNNTGRGQVK